MTTPPVFADILRGIRRRGHSRREVMGKPDSISVDLPLEDCAWLRAFARSLLEDAQRADDAAQETWVAAIERGPRGGRIPRGWLATVVRNRARQFRRSEARRAVHEQRGGRDARAPSAAEVVERIALQKRLLEAVDALGEPYRTAIVMRFFDGLPPREIARRQGRPVKTVDTHLARGLAKLRERLDEGDRGARNAWLTVLLPLAKPSKGALAVGLLGAVMNLKLLLAAVVLLLSGAILWLNVSDREPERDEPRAIEEPVLLAGGGIREVPVAEPPRLEESEAREARRRAVPATPAEVEEAPVVPVTLVGYTRDLGGRAVAELEIGFVDLKEEGTFRPAGRSDGEGRFEVPLPEQNVRLDVRDDNYSALIRPYVEGSLAPREAPVITVARGRCYAGVVRDEAGNPLAGTDLRISLRRERAMQLGLGIYTTHTIRAARSDDAGGFEFVGVPWTEGALLLASRGGYESVRLELPPEDRRDLQLAMRGLEDGAHTLFGLVCDARGNGVAEAHVSAGGRVVRSDEQGNFRLAFEGDPHGAVVRALKPGYAPAEREVAGAEGSTLDFPLVLECGASPLSIHGRVLDADGEALSGVVVSTFDLTRFGDIEMRLGDVEFLTDSTVESILSGGSEHFTKARRATSDARGEFTIEGLMPRTYTLHALHPHDFSTIRAPAAAGDSRVELQFERVPRTRVSGRVLSLSGFPLAGLEVRPERRIDGEESHILSRSRDHPVFTDEDGGFAFEGVDVRSLTLKFHGPRLAWSEVVDLEACDDLERLELHFAASARLRVSAAGPLAGGETIVIHDSANEPLQFSMQRGEMTILLDDLPIIAEAEYLIETDERARWILLLDADGEELANLPVRPDPDDIREVCFP